MCTVSCMCVWEAGFESVALPPTQVGVVEAPEPRLHLFANVRRNVWTLMSSRKLQNKQINKSLHHPNPRELWAAKRRLNRFQRKLLNADTKDAVSHGEARIELFNGTSHKHGHPSLSGGPTAEENNTFITHSLLQCSLSHLSYTFVHVQQNNSLLWGQIRGERPFYLLPLFLHGTLIFFWPLVGLQTACGKSLQGSAAQPRCWIRIPVGDGANAKV